MLEYLLAQAIGSVVTNQVTSRWSEQPATSTTLVVRNPPGVPYDPHVASRFEKLERSKSVIAEIRALAGNWDGHGALSISQEAVEYARQLLESLASVPSLPLPDITPTPSGTIGLAWDGADLDAYIEIGRTRCSGYVRSGSGEPTLLEGSAGHIDDQVLGALALAVFGSQGSAPAFAQLRTIRCGIDDRLAA